MYLSKREEVLDAFSSLWGSSELFDGKLDFDGAFFWMEKG